MIPSASSWSRGLLSRVHRLGLTNPPRQSLSYIPLAPPPLFDLCVRRSFDEALQRVQTHPHEARFKHPRNWTALHCCVEHVAPLPVVQAIYQAHPESLTAKDWQGITPEEAAVDPETKAFLKQALKEQLEGKESTSTSTVHASSSSTTATPQNNDPMFMGKILAHANNLSEQVSELDTKTKALQKEIEELKATLRAMTTK